MLSIEPKKGLSCERNWNKMRQFRGRWSGVRFTCNKPLRNSPSRRCHRFTALQCNDLARPLAHNTVQILILSNPVQSIVSIHYSESIFTLWEISQLSGMYNPIYPSCWQCIYLKRLNSWQCMAILSSLIRPLGCIKIKSLGQVVMLKPMLFW